MLDRGQLKFQKKLLVWNFIPQIQCWIFKTQNDIQKVTPCINEKHQKVTEI